ncbi:MAG: helix-turn-helix domain-containing protein [Clostridia bacterium]|nr:helix-turn-helix domain-containing protein [Clostridia bacterium]
MSKNRDLILASARDIFSTRSFEQVTIKEICRHAGVANSTFYYHFKTKEELMDCLRTRDEHPMEHDLLSILTMPDLMEQTLTACTMCAARAERHGCTLTTQYYKRRLDKGADTLDSSHRQEHAAAQALIARAQSEGLILNPAPSDQLTQAAIGLVTSTVIDWCVSDGSFDLLPVARQALYVLFGLCSEDVSE